MLFNANDETLSFTDAALAGWSLQLHSVQQNSTDPVVRESEYDETAGSFMVPGRTTAVFVEVEVPTAIT